MKESVCSVCRANDKGEIKLYSYNYNGYPFSHILLLFKCIAESAFELDNDHYTVGRNVSCRASLPSQALL